ncbi:class I SAM-dependent methyltransferase [Altibacter sp. HG106]|uniref:class I SAM-dependent methyltransferase n=1 Tax=Altibacter sp. HG106 TaxID=3023937 RepID=UPI002350CCC8|nr:class I SAM-dependent methyltransferase [Altibacter sp. HG106]MDC7995707.1 class I SAM-dependent methyltransferase [Altibacter sp. HG106]
MGVVKKLKSKIKNLPAIHYYLAGKTLLNDKTFKEGQELSTLEKKKQPKRTVILNFLLDQFSGPTHYLEIGVRNPNHNFNHIHATHKYSVDPGIEYAENPVDFPYTSDVFFDKLSKGELLEKNTKFHVIFIDGLHLADQVNRDIENALACIEEDGFIVLHDCNPPTEWHTRDTYGYTQTPANNYWNGTTWKAFLKFRMRTDLYSCCIDTDWGVGIVSKSKDFGGSVAPSNEFYEYHLFHHHRKEHLNLMPFTDFKSLF